MNCRRSSRPALWFLVTCLSSLVPSLFAAGAKETILIDYADTRTDPDGTVFRPWEYAYGDWDKHVTGLKGRGLLVKAPGGKGGLGENKTGVSFSGCTAVDLAFAVGNGNQATAINFSLEDKDGTEQSWAISLAGAIPGREVRAHLVLAKFTTEAKPGKTPGLNLKKIATWQVRGDYTEAKVEVLLLKLYQSQ